MINTIAIIFHRSRMELLLLTMKKKIFLLMELISLIFDSDNPCTYHYPCLFTYHYLCPFAIVQMLILVNSFSPFLSLQMIDHILNFFQSVSQLLEACPHCKPLHNSFQQTSFKTFLFFHTSIVLNPVHIILLG